MLLRSAHPYRTARTMKADNRGLVMHLRRAAREDDWDLADFLTDEIVRHLDLLDALDPTGEIQLHAMQLDAAKRLVQDGAQPVEDAHG